MKNRFKFKYVDGKIVERSAELSADKNAQLAGQTKSFLRSLVSAILTQNFTGKFSKFSNFNTDDLAGIAALVAAAPAVIKANDVKPFTLHQEEHGYSNKVVKTEVVPEGEKMSKSKQAYRYALNIHGGKLPTTIEEMTRLALCAIRFSRSGPDSAASVSPVQPPPSAVEGLVPDMKPVGEDLISTFGESLKSVEESEKVISTTLQVSDEYRENFATIQDDLVPRQFTIGRSHGRQVLIRNDVARISEDKYTGRQARNMVQNLLQVPVSDRTGLGVFAQSHYDGCPAKGIVRKYMEVLQDYDYSKSLPIVRLLSSDPNAARALKNAILHKGLVKKCLVVYDGNDSSQLRRYWDGSKILRSGILAYPGNMFDSAFRGHLQEVYYYSTNKPITMTSQAPEALYESNQKLLCTTEFLEKYGYFSLYATMSSLITEGEFSTFQKVKKSLAKPRNYGYASSCKVRKGWFRVTPDGQMDTKQVIIHVANGRLHYLTWLYRTNPFAAEGDNDGHTIGYAPLYDWVTGRETHAVDPKVFHELEGLNDPKVKEALKDLLGDVGEKESDKQAVDEEAEEAEEKAPEEGVKKTVSSESVVKESVMAAEKAMVVGAAPTSVSVKPPKAAAVNDAASTMSAKSIPPKVPVMDGGFSFGGLMEEVENN